MARYDIAALRDTIALNRITDFAAALCAAPTSVVSLVGQYRQTFIARTGVDATDAPRETSFCQYAMLENDVMVVPDATADPRFAHNPLVTGDPHIRFYAGAPLVAEDGMPLGSLCVIDMAPRAGLTELQRQGFAVLASDVMTRLSATLERAKR